MYFTLNLCNVVIHYNLNALVCRAIEYNVVGVGIDGIQEPFDGCLATFHCNGRVMTK